jgi:hypothetical protein
LTDLIRFALSPATPASNSAMSNSPHCDIVGMAVTPSTGYRDAARIDDAAVGNHVVVAGFAIGDR